MEFSNQMKSLFFDEEYDVDNQRKDINHNFEMTVINKDVDCPEMEMEENVAVE